MDDVVQERTALPLVSRNRTSDPVPTNLVPAAATVPAGTVNVGVFVARALEDPTARAASARAAARNFLRMMMLLSPCPGLSGQALLGSLAALLQDPPREACFARMSARSF